MDGEPAWFHAIDEARQEWRTGQITQQGRRAQKPGVPAQERYGNALAPEVTVHPNGHDLVVAQATPELKGRIEGLPHFQRLGAETLTNRIANAIDVRPRLRHGDNRELRGGRLPHEQASHFPVSAVAGHDDDAAPVREQLLEQFVALGRVIEQLAGVGRVEGAKEIDAVERVLAEGSERSEEHTS